MAESADADKARAAAGAHDSGRGVRVETRGLSPVEPGLHTGDAPEGSDGPAAGLRQRFDKRTLWLIGPTLAILAVVILYPVLRAMYMSTQANKGYDETLGRFVKGGFVGFDHYKLWLLQDCGGGFNSCPPGTNGSDVWSSIGITFFFAAVTVTIEVLLGLWMATVMSRSFFGRSMLRASVLIPWAIPTAVTAKLWYFIFAEKGIANQMLGTTIAWTTDPWAARFAVIIADVWKTTPFMALLILAGLQMIPKELHEAARVDGASAWQRFTKITLPLVKPALMVAVLFRTMDALRMYDLPAILVGSGGGTPTSTMSILVVAEMKGGANANSASALSTIVFLIIFVVAFILVKYLGANAVRTQDDQRKGAGR